MEMFRFQLLNGVILYECPLSYFDNSVQAFYVQYNRLKLMKVLGIKVEAKDISLLELEAYHIIEVEINKAQDAKSKQESKKKN